MKCCECEGKIDFNFIVPVEDVSKNIILASPCNLCGWLHNIENKKGVVIEGGKVYFLNKEAAPFLFCRNLQVILGSR